MLKDSVSKALSENFKFSRGFMTKNKFELRTDRTHNTAC